MNGARKNKAGFALIEVLIALFIFAIFMAVFATTQGYNLTDSFNMKEEQMMSEIAKNEINKILLEPPKNFSPSLFIGPGDTKQVEGNEKYNKTIKYKEFFIPDFNKMQGTEKGQASNGFDAKIYQEVKTNLEKMLCQVEVTITNRNTGFKYTISTFILNSSAQVQLMGF